MLLCDLHRCKPTCIKCKYVCSDIFGRAICWRTQSYCNSVCNEFRCVDITAKIIVRDVDWLNNIEDAEFEEIADKL